MRVSFAFVLPLAALSAIGLTYFASQVPRQPELQAGQRLDEPVAWQAVEVVTGLNRPWSIAWLPDGSALITEKDGRLRRLQDRNLSEPLSGLPKIYAGGQGGLMDVSLHPKFATNRAIYLTYSVEEEGGTRTVLARGKWNGQGLEGVTPIFKVSRVKPGGAHFGSRIQWLPDGTLLLAIGDGGNPPTSLDGDYIRKKAQDTNIELGKVLRLTDEGKPAKDNPLAAQGGVAAHVWSLGHRNIQGLTRDPKSGRIYATEHGPRGGDELNLIEKGANYGWPVVTFGAEYSGPKITEETSRPGFKDPLAVWTPSLAPSGLTFYNGDKIPDWKGSLFAGQLAGKQINRFTLDKDGIPTAQYSLKFPQRVRDVRQGPDGFLYVLTDEGDGKLLRLEAK